MAFTEETISKLRYQIAETRYRIQLRLNPEEAEHKELLRLMKVAIERQQQMLDGAGETDTTLKAVEAAAAYAPQILKAEWNRVKQGELAFRLARNWFAPVVILAPIVFVILLWAGKVKI